MGRFVISILLAVVPGWMFAQSYTISTIAGGGLPVNIAGNLASLSALGAVTADAAGNIFFASSHTVLRLDAQTKILTLMAGNGTGGFSGDNGPAVDAQLLAPSGLAVDSSGTLYIADSGNYTLRKVRNGMITTVAGNGQFGFSGDGGPAANAQLSTAPSVAVDAAGDVYIADRDNQRVRKISGGIITTIAGTGTAGSSGDGVPALGAKLSNPSIVAVDSKGIVYIAEGQGIRKLQDGMITTIPGGSPFERRGFTAALAVDADGNVFVTEGNVVRQISRGVTTTIAGDGTAGFGGDEGPATSAKLNNPMGLAVDGSGTVYVADTYNIRLRRISNGIITTAAGNGEPDFSGDGGPATRAQLGAPSGVAVDGAGNIYIADGRRVRQISHGAIDTVAGTGQAGSSGDNGPARSAQFSALAIAVDRGGSDLYILDSLNGRVRKVAGGAITTVAGDGTAVCTEGSNIQLREPRGIALDAVGNLYVSDSSDRCVVKISSGVVTGVIGGPLAESTGDNVPATDAVLGLPWGVGVDADGTIYIVAAGDGLIRKVANGVVTTVAGGGTAADYNDGPVREVGLGPTDMALDGSGALYFVDGNRIRKITGETVTTIAGNMQWGFGGDGGPATKALVNSPMGLAVDSAGNVYFSDSGNNRIRMLTPIKSDPGTTSVPGRSSAEVGLNHR